MPGNRRIVNDAKGNVVVVETRPRGQPKSVESVILGLIRRFWYGIRRNRRNVIMPAQPTAPAISSSMHPNRRRPLTEAAAAALFTSGALQSSGVRASMSESDSLLARSGGSGSANNRIQLQTDVMEAWGADGPVARITAHAAPGGSGGTPVEPIPPTWWAGGGTKVIPMGSAAGAIPASWYHNLLPAGGGLPKVDLSDLSDEIPFSQMIKHFVYCSILYHCQSKNEFGVTLSESQKAFLKNVDKNMCYKVALYCAKFDSRKVLQYLDSASLPENVDVTLHAFGCFDGCISHVQVDVPEELLTGSTQEYSSSLLSVRKIFESSSSYDPDQYTQENERFLSEGFDPKRTWWIKEPELQISGCALM